MTGSEIDGDASKVDGDQHGTDEAPAFDARRTRLIEAREYKVLCFSNHDVLRSLGSVLDTIAAAAGKNPNPDPIPHGGGQEIAFHG